VESVLIPPYPTCSSMLVEVVGGFNEVVLQSGPLLVLSVLHPPYFSPFAYRGRYTGL
jgi:hypothetical protein